MEPDITNELLRALLNSTYAQKQEALRVLKGEASQQVKPVDPEPYLTLREVARRLNVSACSLWRWGVPGHELGGRPKFRMGEVLAYLESDAFRKRAAELRREDRARRIKPK